MLEVRRNKGQSVMNKFMNAEADMKNILKYPEIFHWLGLFQFAYLERNLEQAQKQREEEKKE